MLLSPLSLEFGWSEISQHRVETLHRISSQNHPRLTTRPRDSILIALSRAAEVVETRTARILCVASGSNRPPS